MAKKKKPANRTLALPFGKKTGSVNVRGYTVKPHTRKRPKKKKTKR